MLLLPAMHTGCANHYKGALRDLAMTPQERLADRIDGLERAARAAVGSLEAAWASSAGIEARTPLLNDAESWAFEYRRQVLIVGDVLPESNAADALRDSMSALADALDEGILTTEEPASLGHAPPPEMARAALARLERDADALLSGQPPVERSR